MPDTHQKTPDEGKVKHLSKAPDGRYVYFRRVPSDCQKALRLKAWNRGLGRDYDAAVMEAVRLRHKHDAQIARLRGPEAAEEKTAIAVERTQKRIAELEAAGAPSGVDGEQWKIEDRLSQLWRRIPDVMRSAAEDPAREYQQLAKFAAMAFGNRDRVGGADQPELAPPTDAIDKMTYDFHRNMIAQRLEELAPLPDPTPEEDRVAGLMERYLSFMQARDNTKRAYRGKVRALVRHLGDHDLPYYTKERLQAHRDLLIEEVDDDGGARRKPTTITQHFAPLKALWNWASDEVSGLGELQFPKLRLPKPGESIEETRWQAFDDAEIKQVWGLLNQAWGADAVSRVAPERRRAFLMAVRVLLYTGMRPAEVFRLTAADVKNGVIHIRKTKTTGRKIPLSKHIADLPDFLSEGGFDHERTVKSASTTMSDSFTTIIRPHFQNDRHVLYSLKDTLVDRLQRQPGMSDDVIRGIIGHVSGQGHTRNYKTPFGESEHGMKRMREALDAIMYW